MEPEIEDVPNSKMYKHMEFCESLLSELTLRPYPPKPDKIVEELREVEFNGSFTRSSGLVICKEKTQTVNKTLNITKKSTSECGTDGSTSIEGCSRAGATEKSGDQRPFEPADMSQEAYAAENGLAESHSHNLERWHRKELDYYKHQKKILAERLERSLLRRFTHVSRDKDASYSKIDQDIRKEFDGIVFEIEDVTIMLRLADEEMKMCEEDIERSSNETEEFASFSDDAGIKSWEDLSSEETEEFVSSSDEEDTKNCEDLELSSKETEKFASSSHEMKSLQKKTLDSTAEIKVGKQAKLQAKESTNPPTANEQHIEKVDPIFPQSMKKHDAVQETRKDSIASRLRSSKVLPIPTENHLVSLAENCEHSGERVRIRSSKVAPAPPEDLSACSQKRKGPTEERFRKRSSKRSPNQLKDRRSSKE